MPWTRSDNVLLFLLLSGLDGQMAMARAADASFILTATESDFSRYYPTYLANGYWSAGSSPLGTSATVAHTPSRN
jgi:hypothetical protein